MKLNLLSLMASVLFIFASSTMLHSQEKLVSDSTPQFFYRVVSVDMNNSCVMLDDGSSWKTWISFSGWHVGDAVAVYDHYGDYKIVNFTDYDYHWVSLVDIPKVWVTDACISAETQLITLSNGGVIALREGPTVQIDDRVFLFGVPGQVELYNTTAPWIARAQLIHWEW